ncbi:MAG: SGNH/GDSL hydrolase family protein [Planctomycetes bacterium]|nr:SGNH/GDSL hydrolase family protein [Planctomycetota bacterium]
MEQETPQSGTRTRRREFLALAAAGSIGPLSLATTGCAVSTDRAHESSIVREPCTVLFQGDSITDAHRVRESEGEPNRHPALGNGYALLASAALLTRSSAPTVKCYNRGISGNKVFQLADRWDRDCIDIEPDVLSILIGVNDIWHKRNGDYDGTLEIYERDYDALLERTRRALPGVRIVVCEPFLLRCGVVDGTWFPEFDTYREAAQRVASKHDAAWVAFQTVFDRACEIAPPEHWAKDGVHPTPAGAALMAQAWLDVCAPRT